jgi:hypothetical protein
MSGRGQEHEVELAELLEEVRSLRKAIDELKARESVSVAFPPDYAVLVRSGSALPPDYAVLVRPQTELPPGYEVLVRPAGPETEGPLVER